MDQIQTFLRCTKKNVGPQSGMRVECSVESVIVPTNLSNLTAIMGNLDTWASVFSDIVYHKDCPYLSDDILLLQVISQEMQDINMGRSAFHDHFGFYQSSLSGNQLQQNQWFGGKRRG
ncbi:hypothetical protein F0562_021107 [Nyssa sinensis]|uniref:Uncharacterized protein n=1 Tax=Nyssa sinensis TaxID=561372 RepID=A0A5J5BL67_9ASTE|nr:hypothetical protein F0562_021107 [Nyssa sinensis]